MEHAFQLPLSITVKSEGAWHNNTNEVSIDGSKIILQTGCASWIKIEWAAHFESDALFLNDAWERTYGNVGWKRMEDFTYSPWYFSVIEGKEVHCYGVKTGPSAMCAWLVEKNRITLLLDVRCGCLDTLFDGRRVVLAELVSHHGTKSAFDVIHEFCHMMCEHPILPSQPFYGGDDWYDSYGDNSFEKIISHAKKLAECSQGLKNRPYQTVDAGWQKCHNWYPGDEYIGGPFTECNFKFGDMRKMADGIRELDIRPGIWLRPLETVEYVPDECILRRSKNIKYLDPTHPFTIEKADADLRRLIDWGYELIKHDFAAVDIFGHYGPEMTQSIVEGDWTFYDRSRTSAEIMLEYYRQAAQSAKGALINVCNTFSHLSAGIFPVFRIGDDISGFDHKRTVEMGVNTLAFRGVQHNAFYAVDPDVVAFTRKVPVEYSMQWMELLKASGTSMLVSIEHACYTHQVRDAITEAFHNAATQRAVAKAIDWQETCHPEQWETFEGIKTIHWKY